MSTDHSEKIARGGARSDHTDALIEFGKKYFVDSLTIIGDFIKMMIPLTTGLITAYFALLKFLGVEEAINTNKVNATTLIDPTIFMFWSVAAFVVISFPLLMRVNVGNLPSIESFRLFMIIWRYAGAAIGMGFFLYGLLTMIDVVKRVI